MPSYTMQGSWKEIPDGLNRILWWMYNTENSTPEREWREISAEDYRFYAGNQDYDWAKQKLEAAQRPTSTFNECKPKIDMLIGLASQGRHDTTLIPVGGEDEALAELMNGTLKHYRNQLKLSRKELDCFEHMVKSGRSMLYFWIDTTNPFVPKICTTRLRGSEYYLDPYSKEYDGSDARYLFIEKWFTEEDLQLHWPDMDPSEIQSFGQRYADLPQFFNEARDLYRIMECWYYKYEEVIWYVNPITGEVESLPPVDYKKFLQACVDGIPQQDGTVKQIDPQQIQSGKGQKKVPWYCIFSGFKVLEEGKSQHNWEGFPGINFGAYKDEDTNAWFGAITMMKDPQRASNTMLRQLTHLLQTLPKGILATEVGNILNIDDYKENSSEPNFFIETKVGGIDKFKFVQQPMISPLYAQVREMFKQSIKDGSGIQDPLMGIQESSREAGVTNRQRMETGMAVLYLLFSNFQESRHNATRLLMSLIQQYSTMPEVIRIEGDNGIQLQQINTQLNRQSKGFNDITAMKFDLEVQDTAETATTRIMIAQILAEVNHNSPGIIPPDIILDYSDVPFSVKQRVKKQFETQQGMAQQESNAKIQQVQQEAQMKQAELELRAKELELKDKELEIKKLEVLLKNRDMPVAPKTTSTPKRKVNSHG